jgi:hypothetical protein
MDSQHFTADGEGLVKAFGRTLRRTAGIVSERGAGATTQICPFGRCRTWGVGVEWDTLTRLPPLPQSIGADLDRYRTISASAGGGSRRVRRTTVVRRHDAVLQVSVAGSGVSDLRLIAPDGRRITLARPGPWASGATAPDGKEAVLMVAAPHPGRWKIDSVSKGAGIITVQRAPDLGAAPRLTATPKTTARRRLGRRTLTVRWTKRHFARRVGVTLNVSPRRDSPGLGVARARASSGKMRIPGSRLGRGKHYLTLVFDDRGVPFRTAKLKRSVWH